MLLHLWQRHNGSNNGEIVYAVRDAEDEGTGIGLSKDQASRALAELIERGFLRVARNSAFKVKTKEARTWTLTAEPVGDKPATKDFLYWSSATPQSHQRDRQQAEKFKTRSHQRDTQYHQRDRGPENETILPLSVAPARPSTPKSGPSRSHECDTSNIPCVPAKARGGVTAQESDSAARAKRTVLDPVPVGTAARAPAWPGGIDPRPPRFGDDAKAQRTARAPRSVDADEDVGGPMRLADVLAAKAAR